MNRHICEALAAELLLLSLTVILCDIVRIMSVTGYEYQISFPRFERQNMKQKVGRVHNNKYSASR